MSVVAVWGSAVCVVVVPPSACQSYSPPPSFWGVPTVSGAFLLFLLLGWVI